MYLDVHFSCAQRMITPVCSNTQKGSLEDRVCAIFSSIFLIVDASFHLLAATYKGFGWTAFQISRKNPPDYYKEAYSHFIKVLLYTPIIFFMPFSCLLGFISPSVFQSEKLQKYLGWKASLINNSKTIENKKLKEELRSIREEFESLKLQINSCDKIVSPTVSENDLPCLEDRLNGMVNPASLRTEDIVSVSSESDEEFVDAIENTSILDEKLEKEILLKDQEIEKLKSQIDLLNKSLSSNILQRKSLTENLFSAKTDLLDKILFPLKNLHCYNQVLVVHEALSKSIEDTSIIYGYLSESVKEKIDKAFQHSALKMSFLQFCNQETPHIEPASQILKKLLDEHTFRYWSNPKEGSICTIIKTLFGFI